MQTEKSQPERKRIMPETRFTEFTALSVDPRVGISRSAEKSQPQHKRIKPETRFTELTALYVDPRVGISRSASETDNCLFFLPMTV